HVQDHDLDLVANLDHLGRVDVLVGPVHLRHVHQALDARLDLDERTVVGDVGDLAEHAGVGRVAAGDVLPRILAQLLEAQRDAVALAVVLEHADLELLADLHHLGRMAHALPRHVGDVQQAVDAAQVDERAVVGEVLDHALEHGALDQRLHQRLTLLGVLALDDGTARDDHVVALAVELDELELEFLALEVHRVADRAHVDQRARQERADVLDVDGEAALDLAADAADHGLVLLERFLQLVPDHGALGLLARQHGLAEAVLDRVQRHLDGVADGDVDLAGVVTELLDRDDALGLQARVDDHHVGTHVHDGTGDDGAGLELRQVGLAGFEQFCEWFGHLIYSVDDTDRVSMARAPRSTRLSACAGLRMAVSVVVDRIRAGTPARGRCLHCPNRPGCAPPAPPWGGPVAPRATRACGQGATTDSTRSTTPSMPMPVVSMWTAPGAGRSGATARLASRASRARISRSRQAIVTETPLPFNCL